MKRSMRFLTTVLTAIMLLAVLASCGASDMAGNDNRYMDKSSGTEVSAPSVGGDKGWNGVYGKGEPGEDMSMPDGETRADFEEKLIKTVRLEAETKEYDAALKALDEMISEVGGYIESSSSSGRSLAYAGDYYRRNASYTIRIPAAKLEEFMVQAAGIFNVTYSTSDVKNVTGEYYDIKTRIGVLESERDSLQAMMEKAEDVETMLAIKKQLYDVIYEIESYKTQLNLYDSRVNYSTVYLGVEEVVEFTRVTTKTSWGTRLVNAFKDSWVDFGNGFQNFTVWILYALPTVLVILVIGVAVFLIVRAVSRKAEKKHAEKRRAARERAQANARPTTSGTGEDWRCPITPAENPEQGNGEPKNNGDK